MALHYMLIAYTRTLYITIQGVVNYTQAQITVRFRDLSRLKEIPVGVYLSNREAVFYSKFLTDLIVTFPFFRRIYA